MSDMKITIFLGTCSFGCYTFVNKHANLAASQYPPTTLHLCNEIMHLLSINLLTLLQRIQTDSMLKHNIYYTCIKKYIVKIKLRERKTLLLNAQLQRPKHMYDYGTGGVYFYPSCTAAVTFYI